MNTESRYSLNISHHTTYRDDLDRHIKNHTKYLKNYNFSSQTVIKDKRKWLLFFKRTKNVHKLNSLNEKLPYFQPSLDIAIEALKGKRSLKSLPIHINFGQAHVKADEFLACKLFTSLKFQTRLELSLEGDLEKSLSSILTRSHTLNKLTVYKIQLHAPALEKVEAAKAFKTLYKTLNRLYKLEHFTFYPRDIKLSDDSLREIFRFDKLRIPLKVLKILTDRLLNIEDDADDFDDFDNPNSEDGDDEEEKTEEAPVAVSLQPEKVWEGFSNIGSLGKTLYYLHLQPLLRTAADQAWLKYFFLPLGQLENLNTLIIEAQNLELCELDVKALTQSFNSLRNLRKLDLLFQFGSLTKKALGDFFDSFKGLNLHEMGINLNFATTADYTKFFNALGHNLELRVMRFYMVFLGKFVLESSFCDLVNNCKYLDNLDISVIPMANVDSEEVEEIDTCFRKMVEALGEVNRLKKFRCYNPKLSADSANLDSITKMIGSIPNLEELTICPNMVGHSVNNEVGMRFWEAIVKNTRLKKLVLTFIFEDADKIMSFIRGKLSSMKVLEYVYLTFESETLKAEQIMWLVRQVTKWENIKELCMHFKGKTFIGSKTTDKIQEILKKPPLLEKGYVEIESNEGQQTITAETKMFTRYEDL